MTDNNLIQMDSSSKDLLGELLKQGAQQLLARAIEEEVAEQLEQYGDVIVNGKKAVVRNGYLPERTIQTGIGDIPVIEKINCFIII